MLPTFLLQVSQNDNNKPTLRERRRENILENRSTKDEITKGTSEVPNLMIQIDETVS